MFAFEKMSNLRPCVKDAYGNAHEWKENVEYAHITLQAIWGGRRKEEYPKFG